MMRFAAFSISATVMEATSDVSFTMLISNDRIPSGKICNDLKELFAGEKIELEKRSKKGMKTVDIRPGIRSFEITERFDAAELNIVLSAGSSDNVNPNLILTALSHQTGEEYDADITRNDLYNSDMELFR